ncbi:MAG: hypothetical protein HOP03_15615 [Lysobacter sp.]|nr:hypothetical protein [Lysobacter sp.]
MDGTGSGEARQAVPTSLFVLSLPRSLSTVVYHAACMSLDLSQPAWTTDGELLNSDRFARSPGDDAGEPGTKYTQRGHAPTFFDDLGRFLDRTVSLQGHGYKDVVHPFVCAAWLADGRFPTLKLRRDPAEVAMSMLARGWHYPATVASPGRALDVAVIEGLLRAWRAIDAVPGVTLDYDAVIADEDALHAALAELYPEVPLRRVRFIDSAFGNDRDHQLARRETDEYRRLSAIVDAVASDLDAVPHSNGPDPKTAGA